MFEKWDNLLLRGKRFGHRFHEEIGSLISHFGTFAPWLCGLIKAHQLVQVSHDSSQYSQRIYEEHIDLSYSHCLEESKRTTLAKWGISGISSLELMTKIMDIQVSSIYAFLYGQ